LRHGSVKRKQQKRADVLVLPALCSRLRYAYCPTAATFGAARLT
jgi:hypothetical protein